MCLILFSGKEHLQEASSVNQSSSSPSPRSLSLLDTMIMIILCSRTQVPSWWVLPVTCLLRAKCHKRPTHSVSTLLNSLSFFLDQSSRYPFRSDASCSSGFSLPRSLRLGTTVCPRCCEFSRVQMVSVIVNVFQERVCSLMSNRGVASLFA